MDKRIIMINGTAMPAIVVSEARKTLVEVPSRIAPGTKRTITTFRAGLVSLRTTLPDKDGNVTTFYAYSDEDLGFALPRFDSVAGLDFIPETGEVPDAEWLVGKAAAAIAARQQARQTASQDTEVELTL